MKKINQLLLNNNNALGVLPFLDVSSTLVVKYYEAAVNSTSGQWIQLWSYTVPTGKMALLNSVFFLLQEGDGTGNALGSKVWINNQTFASLIRKGDTQYATSSFAPYNLLLPAGTLVTGLAYNSYSIARIIGCDAYLTEISV